MKFSWEKFNAVPIVGIIRGIDKEAVLKIAKVYSEAGFTTLEITMNTDGACDIISILRKEYPNLNVGAGTVCNLEQFENAVTAGAQFIVTPIIDETVIQKSVELDIPVFPGAYTPTEIYKAWKLGASVVKVFPASQLGVHYIKDVMAPLNDIKLLPTGGVTKENIKSFFEAGVAGVGMGGSLFIKSLIASNDFDGLKEIFLGIKNEIPAHHM